ncbi:MAG: hypothetical protein ACK4Z4_12530, partial [Ferrovibrio sp.]
RRHHDQPGCAVAIASGDEIVLEAAFGTANLATGEALTPRQTLTQIREAGQAAKAHHSDR